MARGIRCIYEDPYFDSQAFEREMIHPPCSCGKNTCVTCNPHHPAYPRTVHQQASALVSQNKGLLELLRHHDISIPAELEEDNIARPKQLLDLPVELHRQIMGYVVAHYLEWSPNSYLNNATIKSDQADWWYDPTDEILNWSTKACSQLFDAALKELIKILKLQVDYDPHSGRRCRSVPPAQIVRQIRPNYLATIRQVELEIPLAHDQLCCFVLTDHQRRVQDALQYIDLIPAFMPHLRRFFLKFLVFDIICAGDVEDFDWWDTQGDPVLVPFNPMKPWMEVKEQAGEVKASLVQLTTAVKQIRGITTGVKMAAHSFHSILEWGLVDNSVEEVRGKSIEEACEAMCKIENAAKLYIV